MPEAEKPVGGCADGGACDGVRRAPVVVYEAGNGTLQRKQAGCAEARAHIDSAQTTRTLLAAKRAGNLLKRFAPRKYEGILREIDRISRLGSIAQQAESLQQLLQGSGVIFRLLTNGFRKA